MTDISLERPMPSDLEAERAVLGSVLLTPPALCEACEACGRDDFYLEGHRRIFHALLRLQAAEIAIDYVTLKDELRRSGELEAAGGPAYLVSLTDGLPRAINIRHYAGIVRQHAVLRRLIQLGNDAMTRAYQAEEAPKDIIGDLQLALIKLAETAKRGGWLKISDLVAAAYSDLEALAHHKADVTGLEYSGEVVHLIRGSCPPLGAKRRW